MYTTNMVCFRYIHVNTLHKGGGGGGGGGDDDDDDDDDKDLRVEMQHMWNIETNVILVIIAAIETVSQSFRKYLSNIRGKHKIKELQKTAILGITHLLRLVQM
jgi:hypothetical protein